MLVYQTDTQTHLGKSVNADTERQEYRQIDKYRQRKNDRQAERDTEIERD